MSSRVQVEVHMAEVNGVSLSVMTVVSMPKRETQLEGIHPAQCMSILLAVEMVTPCTSILLAAEIDTPCTFILLVVKRDMPCASIMMAREMDTPCMSILLLVERNTPCMSILLVLVVVKGIPSVRPNCTSIDSC
jgi:hypothetical protein